MTLLLLRAWTAARAMTVRDVTVVAFAVVAAVGAVISFDHIHELVTRVGTGTPAPGAEPASIWWAPLYPLSVDGLLVAASLALWIDRQSGGRGSFLAWLSAALGLVWSLGANLASTNPDLIPVWVLGPAIAVWPPLALALAFELLVSVWRTESRPDRTGSADEPDRTETDRTGRTDEPQTTPGGLTAAGERELIERLATDLAAGRKLPSGRSLRSNYGIGPDRASRIVAAVRDRSTWIRKAAGS